ncbi:MAG: hypothetical protein AB8B49_04265, partial [Nitratireductor sp.]
LLEKTLSSFQEKVFQNFDVNEVFINIDPFFVKDSKIFKKANAEVDAERDKVEAIARKYFKEITVFRPQVANFTAAEKRLWQHTKAECVLLLEDDWIALDEITPDMVFQNFDDQVRSVIPLHVEKHVRGSQKYFFPRLRKKWYHLKKSENREKPYFSTSPSFWDGKFLRQCAELMDVNFDPEKQFYSGVNPKLEAYVKPFKAKFLRAADDGLLVQDIGRKWQKQSGIEKVIIESKSWWRTLKI